MTFAAPWALLWSLAALPVIVFYILKVRRPRVQVATLMFWEQIFDQNKPRSIWQKLRHLISLLMQLAMVALLVLALAQPRLGWQLLQSRQIVLIIDNSASMNALAGMETRLDRARDKAKELIDGMRFFDTMAIITAGTEPRVVCGLTGHQRTLREAVESIAPTDGPTLTLNAVDIAARLLANEDHPTILALTDQPIDRENVTAVPIVGSDDNVGITQFAVRRSLVDPIGYEILATVCNYGDQPVDCRIELDLNGQLEDVFPLKLKPGEPWTHIFKTTSALGGRLTATIDRGDVLLADNSATAILPRRDEQRVALSGEPNLFLQRVIEAIPLVRIDEQADVTVIHRKMPATLPPGNLLIIDPRESSDLWQVIAPLANPLVAKQDSLSPLMAHVRLDNVYLSAAQKIKPLAKAHILAEALTGEPIYFSIEQDNRRVLVLSAALDEGDLPLRTSFPIMMTNALSWFANHSGELRPSVAAGKTLTLKMPGSAAPTVISPNGKSRPVAFNGDQITVGPFDQCGVWTVTRGDQSIEIPCNLVDQEESNIQVDEDFAKSDRARVMTAGMAGKPIWFYLLMIACVLAAAEWWLYQRRWIS